MVDVGNLELFAETWQKIYAAAGNGRSILSDTTYTTNASACGSWASKGDREVRVKVNGQWGKIPDLGPNDSRDALVASLSKVLDEASKETGYNVFSNCYGTTWQEGVPRWPGPHACGGFEPTVRPDCMCDIGSAQCEFHSWGHQVPSSIKANLYRDGALLADTLTIEFSSNAVQKDEGCGLVGTITKNLVGFIPGGTLFAAGLDIVCA
ncbi:ed24 elicitor [Pyrenophora seminiperda CCB06]|uniref:Ed24 elicitor n=1 Tax=Pyrenophora seminiperda CCB06 TaxID=1302712 RepID=A0A3M7MDJ8_9PLEO|nr:ed24 elicitor [Pyrenophora seminiperda CCB06]